AEAGIQYFYSPLLSQGRRLDSRRSLPLQVLSRGGNDIFTQDSGLKIWVYCFNNLKFKEGIYG
ncbi:MAG TPA: hypothetical protein DEP99_02980, partial [Nitrospiraceae bacterium]|nr:hypothetical protein [Nitrospiraceae bacterium]